jgi:hypothetical protein
MPTAGNRDNGDNDPRSDNDDRDREKATTTIAR